jgi:5-methylcytosine-specific restriction endonuclease McrA
VHNASKILAFGFAVWYCTYFQIEEEKETQDTKTTEKERRLLKKEQYKLKVVIDNSYMCQYCPEKFKSYYQLKSHMVKHKGFQVE